jgi:hypothetical protein
MHEGYQIEKYTVDLKNPAVFADKTAAMRALLPRIKKNHPQYAMSLNDGPRFGHDWTKTNKYVDAQILAAAWSQGYDGLVLLWPQPPATREIAVRSAGQVRRV